MERQPTTQALAEPVALCSLPFARATLPGDLRAYCRLLKVDGLGTHGHSPPESARKAFIENDVPEIAIANEPFDSSNTNARSLSRHLIASATAWNATNAAAVTVVSPG